MKTKKFMSVCAAALAVCGAMSSCSTSGHNEYTETLNFTGYINGAFVAGASEPDYTSGLSYYLTMNYTTATTDIQLSGFKLPQGSVYSTLNLEKLPWTYSDGWNTFSSASITPTSATSAPTFNNFKFEYAVCATKIDGNSVTYPLTRVSYETENARFFSFPTGIINVGQLLVTDEKGGIYQQTKDEQSVFVIYLDKDNRTASIAIQDAKFAAAMPAMNMKFNDIKYSINSNGQIELQCDSLTPNLVTSVLNTTEKGTPNPSFPITKLSGWTDSANNMVLNFICTIKMEKEGVTMESQYTVQVVTRTPSSTAS